MRIFILALVVVIAVPAAIAIASDNGKGASAARDRLSVRLVEKTTLVKVRGGEPVTAHCPDGYTVVGTGFATPSFAAPSAVLASRHAVTVEPNVPAGMWVTTTAQAICARFGD